MPTETESSGRMRDAASASSRIRERLEKHPLPGGLPEGDGWSTDRFALQSYSHDLWPRKLLELREQGPPEPQIDLVIWPETTEQVAQVVRWAREADVELYPYGAGSGVCGATIPNVQSGRPRVVVDTKRMRKVRALDRESMTVWAEAGLIGENLERHLNQDGFTLGHFPSSIYCSSVGGYLATRSAGQLSTKYGKIEDMVVSLEVVLPDGTVIETSRAPRSATGPDWTQLLLGSEGTLGFITAGRLQVHPLPEKRELMGFMAPDVAGAIAFTKRLMQYGVRPSVMRIYDNLETSLTIPSEVIQGASGAAIVVVLEGLRGIVEAETVEAKKIAEQLGIAYQGPALGKHWWEHRYHVSYKQQLILSHEKMILDTFEIAATWDKLKGVYDAVKKADVGMGMVLAHFSHFYHTGANIYFSLVAHAGFKSAPEQYDRMWENIMEAAHNAGATLSHHHGVGVQKNEWLRKEKTSFITIFERVKRGFDPENRLNPGKMGL